MQHVQEDQGQKRHHGLLVCKLQTNQGDQEAGSQLQYAQREFHRDAGILADLVQLDPHHREDGAEDDDEGWVEELGH